MPRGANGFKDEDRLKRCFIARCRSNLEVAPFRSVSCLGRVAAQFDGGPHAMAVRVAHNEGAGIRQIARTHGLQ